MAANGAKERSEPAANDTSEASAVIETTPRHLSERAIRSLNRRDIQVTVVQGVVGVMAAAGVCLWWFLLPRDAPDIVVFGWVPGGLALLAACLRLCQVSPGCAGATLIALTLALPAGLHAYARLPHCELLFALPVVLAAALFPPAAAAAAGALCALLLAGVGRGAPEPVAPVAVSLVAACTWVALRPQHSLLQWAWQRSAEATLLAEMLRDRQAELNRSISALDLANRLLQRTNHELAAARREADEARRIKEEFAAGISHELRTPLNIILGFTEIMHESPEVYGDLKWPATLRRDVTEVYRSARYLSDMIDDVLDLARVEAALMPVHREPTDLEAVLSEAVGISRGLVRDRRVSLELAVQPNLPHLLMDRARIRQVVLNLLANAVRHTDSGSVRVSGRLEGDQVVVTVADTGVGIPQEQLESIFSEFRQVDPLRQEDRQGKGLGLAIAKRFVQLHGGSIWAESTVGVGSTFSFSLPLEEKAFSLLHQTEPTRLPPNPCRDCLVVFDQSELSAAYLRRQIDGHEVLWAKDAETLSEICGARHPRAIVVNAAGLAATPGEPARCPDNVPVITCCLPTALPPRPDGAIRRLLTKPVESAALLEALRSLAASGDVMVVDDDRAFVQLVARVLQASGAPYTIRWAYRGEEALAKLRASPADALVLDMMMPGMDGASVAEAMARDERLAHIPILAVTGATGAAGAKGPQRGSFVVEQGDGLGEQQTLGLLRACLPLLRAHYFSEPESAPVPIGTPA